jgi:hypothetical protein
VGWREREYAKLRDDERRALFGSGGTTTHATPRRAGRTAGTATLLVALAASAIAVAFGTDHLQIGIHLPHAAQHAASAAAPSHSASSSAGGPATPVTRGRSKTVLIRWRRSDIAPAPTAGRICVTMREHGRVCATYALGEKPADVLTRRLRAAGLRVESSR